MADVISKTFKSNDIKKYQLEILINTKSKSFLPLSYYEESDQITISYHTEEYSTIMIKGPIKTLNLLQLLQEIVLVIENARDELFFCEDYILSKDTIFKNDFTGDIKFLFLPQTVDISPQENIVRLLADFHQIANTNGAKYLDKIIDYVAVNKPDFKQINKTIDKMCKEVYQCLIE